jgi:hypothetical protein
MILQNLSCFVILVVFVNIFQLSTFSLVDSCDVLVVFVCIFEAHYYTIRKIEPCAMLLSKDLIGILYDFFLDIMCLCFS